MSNMTPDPFTAADLRRLRDLTDALPSGPWEAVELSHLEVHGPAPFDPDVDLDERAWRANEERRAETAAWRGIRSADGARILGEPLPGGRPRPVHQTELLWLAEVRTAVPRLLVTLRELWPRPSRPTAEVASTPPAPLPPERIEKAARAAYERAPGLERWQQLSEQERRGWVARIEAALETLLPDC